MPAEHAFIMVWDGLRPDYVSPAATPILWDLAQRGVWFERSHAVYPTLTRANSPAISTGCRPGRSGIPGNSFRLPATGSPETFSTGNPAHLHRLAEADGRPILLVDTLADRVHRGGGKTVVVGSGSPGSAFLQHPRAAECGDLVIGESLFSSIETLAQRFGPPPRRRVPATDWTDWFTRVIVEFVLPEAAPNLLVFWHTDPDHTTHARGHATPETAQALRDADRHLGAILDCYERLGLRDDTNVVVTSDHGSSMVSRHVKPDVDLAAALAPGSVAENGGSVFVYSAELSAIEAIRALDYAGPVFTRDGAFDTLPLDLVGIDGPRAPEVVFSLAWSDEVAHGLPGTAPSPPRLVVNHGTISPYELRNTLVAEGPDFVAGWRDPAPVGNIDIAPTLTHLLKLDPGRPFDGRVLHEALRASDGLGTSAALRDGSPQTPAWHATEHVTPRQRVVLEHVGDTWYVARGELTRS
jgi:arylsulfatase A-like enzyme